MERGKTGKWIETWKHLKLHGVESRENCSVYLFELSSASEVKQTTVFILKFSGKCMNPVGKCKNFLSSDSSDYIIR